MNHPPSKQAIELWKDLVEAENKYTSARSAFWHGCDANSKVELVKDGLLDPTGAATPAALEMARCLPAEERKPLLDALLSLIAGGEMREPYPHDIVLSLPREWLLENIEQSAEKVIVYADEYDYWQLLGFLAGVDESITQRLADQAARHPDSGIREVGNTFLEKFEETKDK